MHNARELAEALDEAAPGLQEDGWDETCQWVRETAALLRELGGREACHRPMIGFYGADTHCARPKGHRGDCWQVWQQSDWEPAQRPSTRERLEAVAPKERHAHDGNPLTGWASDFRFADGWNACREEFIRALCEGGE